MERDGPRLDDTRLQGQRNCVLPGSRSTGLGSGPEACSAGVGPSGNPLFHPARIRRSDAPLPLQISTSFLTWRDRRRDPCAGQRNDQGGAAAAIPAICHGVRRLAPTPRCRTDTFCHKFTGVSRKNDCFAAATLPDRRRSYATCSIPSLSTSTHARARPGALGARCSSPLDGHYAITESKSLWLCYARLQARHRRSGGAFVSQAVFGALRFPVDGGQVLGRR